MFQSWFLYIFAADDSNDLCELGQSLLLPNMISKYIDVFDENILSSILQNQIQSPYCCFI